jgi:predicted metal-dependent HD superfamily phosphohydrolase
MPFALSADHWHQVRRRYAEGHRRYHDLRHLDTVLSTVEGLADTLGLDAPAREAVRLAALFHDAVYETAPGGDGSAPAGASPTNERASANLARTVLTKAKAPQALVDEVERLVLLTLHHDVTREGPAQGAASASDAAAADPSGAVLCDADLAVLGDQPARYAEYAADVRAEWMHLDDAAFATGRIEVLEVLLRRPWLFTTKPASNRWEDHARRNLATELTLLRTLV